MYPGLAATMTEAEETEEGVDKEGAEKRKWDRDMSKVENYQLEI